MFLSRAVFPLLVSAIMLNLIYFHSTALSQNTPPPVDGNFTTCEECIASACHKTGNGTCAIHPSNSTFMCVSCKADDPAGPKYPTNDSCVQGCDKTTKKCVCDGPCFSCVDTTDSQQYTCETPTQMVNDLCSVLPYGTPPLPPTTTPS